MGALDFNAPTEDEKAAVRRRKGEITREIKRTVLAKYGLDRLPKIGERALVTGGQGTGKSRTTVKQIAAMEGDASVWFVVPTLEKAEEQAAEYRAAAKPASLPAHVVRGRGAPDPRKKDETMCPRHEVVNRAAAMGVNVQATICEGGCQFRFSCGFMRQATILRGNPPGLYLMAADYLWLPCPAPRPDYVIADESVTPKAAEIISFDPARIMDDDKWAVPKDLELAMGLRHTALLVRAAITDHPGRELKFLRSYEVPLSALRDCADHLHRKEEAHPDVAGHMTDKAISDALDMVDAREILKVYKLFRQIIREFNQPRDRLNSVWFDPSYMTKVAGEVERQPRVFVSAIRRPRLRKEIPVLCLDGTGSLALNRKIFGAHMTLERFAAPRDAEVWQVTSKTFSRQSITGTDRNGNPISAQKTHEAARLRQQVLEFLELLQGKVLLVSYKAAIEAMRGDLPPHVEVAHFGGLRGLNSFEDCGTVVVMGREQPSAQAIETMTRPYTATDAAPFLPVAEYVLQSRGRRMRDPDAPNVVEAQVHFDARCQEMLEQIREAELVQAIDRVRPVFNRRRVFVLNNLPLDLTVDHALTWPELRPSNFVRAFARFGVLPLSAVDLPLCFPDFWKDQKTANNALHWLGKNNLRSPNNILFGGIRLFFPEVLNGAYRRKGQRGPLANVLVRSDLPDPRTVLESLIGELTEFHLDRPAGSPAENTASYSAARRLPALPPLAAVLSAEGHLLASLPPDARPPDMLGMGRVIKLMTLAARPERAAAA